jgi:UDP-N-acetylglucosamine--N-acetylmuramyl-(pentapeptide) pyrophosphoryl-undecaprenol N-acetylglucosamine transferase
MRMLLAGGGTGGHLFPAVAIAQRLLETEYGAQVLFVGTERGIEASILPKLGLPLKTIDITGFVGKGPVAKLAILPQLFKACGSRNASSNISVPTWWWESAAMHRHRC